MKKCIAIFLLLACMAALPLVPAQAETNKEAIFYEGIRWLYPLSDTFAAGEVPEEYLYWILQMECHPDYGQFAKYLTYVTLPEDEYEEESIMCTGSGDFPAEELEAFLGQHFTDHEALKASLRNGNPYFRTCTYEDGVYHIELDVHGGFGLGGSRPYCAGYKKIGTNLYEVYHLMLDDEYRWSYHDKDYTFPAEDAGKVYMHIFSGEDETTVRAKIEDTALKSVIRIENGTFAFTSYEKISREAIPADLQSDDWLEPYMRATFFANGASMDISVEHIPVCTYIDIYAHSDPNELDDMLPKDVDSLRLLDITANDQDYKVIHDFHAPSTLYIDIPVECTNPAVYRILGRNQPAEEIPGWIEDGKYVCELTLFGTYALVQKEAKAPEPTTPAPTEPELTEPVPTDPESSAPAPSESEIPSPAPSEPADSTPAPSEPEATEPPADSPDDQEKSGTDLTWLWVVIPIVAVAGIAAAVFLLLKKKK